MQAPREASLKAPGGQPVPAPPVVSFSHLPCGVSLTPENTRPRGMVLPAAPRLWGWVRAVAADALCPWGLVPSALPRAWPQAQGAGQRAGLASAWTPLLAAALTPLSGGGWGHDGRGLACSGRSERCTRRPWRSASRAGCDGQGSGDQAQGPAPDGGGTGPSLGQPGEN